MGAKIRTELILDGLDCANCAAKIERKVNELNGVDSASMNFITKTLTIESDNEFEISKIISRTKDIVNQSEPQVVVTKKNTAPYKKKVFILERLDCANCAVKIENEVGKIDYISNSTVDFVSKQLTVEFESKANELELINNIKKVVKEHEPDVIVKDKGVKADLDKEIEENDNVKSEIFKIAIGALLYLVGIIAKPPVSFEIVVFLISYIIIGGEVLLKAVRNIAKGQIFDENFLMCIATIGAFATKQYPEAVAVMLFYQIGELFQDIAVDRSRKSISSLMDIRPDYANKKVGNEIIRVSPEEINIGDIIVVKPGERIPIDGKVIEGRSLVDTSALTGESVPRDVYEGTEVLSGFVNNNGLLTIEVLKEFGESTISKILDLVQNASSKKASSENFITKFARYYTPVVVISAVLLAFIPPIFLGFSTLNAWVYRALVFLVVSCPCALVVSIPLGFFGGIGGASKKGILIKGGNYLEALNNTEIVVFDKTGTLTKGVFQVSEIEAKGVCSKKDVIRYAAYAESFSNHPIALSIMKAYGENIDETLVEDYEEIMGLGIKAKVEGRDILAGNVKLLEKEKIDFEECSEAGTIVHIVIDRIYAGYIRISDEVKDDSAKAIQELKAIGIKKIVMLTGDNKKIANKIGAKLGVDQICSELLPNQKVEKVEELYNHKSKKGKLIFVGDGINDAPVLSRADVGIAMGGIGSDAAIEASDVVIMTDEPSKLATAIRIAKNTNNIVWQNIIFAIGVKVIILMLGAFGLATMWEAVFGDVGVALIAVLNSMRAMKVKNL